MECIAVHVTSARLRIRAIRELGADLLLVTEPIKIAISMYFLENTGGRMHFMEEHTNTFALAVAENARQSLACGMVQ